MNNPHKLRTGMDRVLHAFGYSMQGLRAALRFESAFRQEAALALVLLPASFWLGLCKTSLYFAARCDAMDNRSAKWQRKKFLRSQASSRSLLYC